MVVVIRRSVSKSIAVVSAPGLVFFADGLHRVGDQTSYQDWLFDLQKEKN